jgi:zinc protease
MLSRILILTGILMTLTLTLPLAASAARATDAPAPTTAIAAPAAAPALTVLENGLSVLTWPDDRFPLASVRLYVHAGSSYEDPKQAGVSHLLEHMVFKGTAKRPDGGLAKEIEAVGGYINAATSFDYTVYYVDVPDEHWRLGLDVIQDMIYGSVFDPADFESEKKVVLSELERGEDDPDSLLFKTVQEMSFPRTSYGWPIIGTRESVSNLTRDDLVGYVKRLYQPQSMLLVVVGRIDTAKVIAEAEALFGQLKNDRLIEPPSVFPPAGLGGNLSFKVKAGNWNKAYLSLAFPAPSLSSEKTAGLEVLTQLLGGDKTSRLYRRFKYKERLVDEIWAANVSLQRGGLILIQATLDADKVRDFLAGLSSELSGLKAADFTAEELDRAKLNLEDSLFRAKETLSGLASKVGYFQFFEHGQQGEANYLYTLRHMDAEQLEDLIKGYLRPERLAGVLLLPEGVNIEPAGLAHIVTANWPAAAGAGKVADAGARGKTEVVKLKTGDTVVLSPDTTLPYAALALAWPGGDALLGEKRQGLAELTSRVLTRGTAGRSAPDIQDFLSDRAASLSAGAARDSFSLSAKYPSRFAPDILALAREVLTQPSFAAEELDRAREEQIADISRREDEPLGLAFRRVFPFLYKNSGYGVLHLGEPDQVRAFSAEELKAFWADQAGRPFVLSVCGEFDRAQILALAEELAASLRKGQSAGFAYPLPAWGEAHDLKLSLPGRNQTHILRIFPVPGLDDPDAPGLELLRAILAGQSGLLFKDLRDRQGLGYTVTAMLWQAPRTGFMAFYIGTAPETEEKSLAGFDAVAARLAAEPLPQEELTRAANLLQGDYYRDHQSLGSRAGEAASVLVKNLGLDYNEALIAKARTLTPQDVQALAAKYLKKDGSYLVTVRP